MKKEIVYAEEYALLLDPKVDVVQGDWALCRTETDVLWQVNENFNVDLDWKVIAHLPLTDDAPILEGVPLLPPLPQGDDVDALAKSQFRKSEYEIELRENAFVLGYNKAKEKYKYTQEDIMNLVQRSHEIYNDGLGVATDSKLLMIIDFIQSLQQPSRPTHFECEMVKDYTSVPKVGNELASFLTPKTITNSQGQEVLVGKYYFEN